MFVPLLQRTHADRTPALIHGTYSINETYRDKGANSEFSVA